MARVLMLLAAPRSFSSLVSTMIGQHPEIYGFPELQLMVGDTVAQVIRWERKYQRVLGPPGLLRAIAELDHGAQTAENVMKAANFIEDCSDWSSARMMKYIVDRAAAVTGAKFCIEKSPAITFLPHSLERARQAFPDALYIHVTRHPISRKRSMDEFVENSARFTPEEREMQLSHSMTVWPVTQRNILDFCASLAPGQYLRIRGEDVLADAAGILRQVAQWLDLRTDEAAVAAMLRPEESPYASLGPVNAPFGNDPKFVASPVFRQGRPRMPRLDSYFETEEGQQMEPGRRAYLTQLVHCMGYS